MATAVLPEFDHPLGLDRAASQVLAESSTFVAGGSCSIDWALAAMFVGHEVLAQHEFGITLRRQIERRMGSQGWSAVDATGHVDGDKELPPLCFDPWIRFLARSLGGLYLVVYAVVYAVAGATEHRYQSEEQYGH